jgi:hypothetical protein
MFRQAGVLVAAALMLAACAGETVEIPDLSVHVLEVAPAGPFVLAVGDTVHLQALPWLRVGTSEVHATTAGKTGTVSVAVVEPEE